MEPVLGKRSSRPAESITGYHTADMNWCGNAVSSSTQKPAADHAICTSRSLLPAGARCCSGPESGLLLLKPSELLLSLGNDYMHTRPVVWAGAGWG